MPSELTIEDDGFANVTLGGVTRSIDLYRVYNEMLCLSTRVKEELADATPPAIALAYTDRLRAALAGLGFTEHVSDRAIDRFISTLHEAVAQLGKTDAVEPTPDSHATTAATS